MSSGCTTAPFEYLTGQYTAIVGAAGCGARACDLRRGIVADGETVTFHLTRPDPEFLHKLVFAWASAVPAGDVGGKRRRRPARYRPYCPYTLDPTPGGSWTAPDLARAERLVAASGTRRAKVTLLMPPASPGAPTPQVGRYVVAVLDRLGYRASMRVTGSANAADQGELGDSSKRPQIGWFTWFQDSPTPSNFIEPLLTCRSFVPRSPDNLNLAEFCDRQIDARIAHAVALEAHDRAATGQLWSRIDRELVDRAPWVSLYNPRTVTVLAPRVGTTSTTRSGTSCSTSSGRAERGCSMQDPG